jgi:hypothetical protein
MTRMLALLALFAMPCFARDLDGRWAQSSPADQQWFRSQKVPGGMQKGVSCCDIADGTFAEEDIRNGGEYWVRYRTQEGVDVDWQRVPDEAVIRDAPNKFGRAVVWYYHINGKPAVRCFIAGAGI